MVDGKSPEWLPPGFSEKVKYKDGRRIKYYQNVATGVKYHSKKDVLNSAAAENGLLSTPQTTNKDDNGLSSNNKVNAILAKTNDCPEWLPNGWTMEERHRKSPDSKGSVYKVYIDMSSGSKFYSKAAVTRHLSSVDRANTMTLRNKVQMSLRSLDKNLGDKLDNVDETVSNISPKPISMTNVGPTSEKKKKGSAFKMVAREIVEADDLPPGWIKEIITSKSGNKTRKDPYYTDPVSGYVFRSKLDVERFLKTNDIGSCACRPKRKDEFDELKLIENEVPSSNPANEKSPEHKTQLLPSGELNGGEEGSGTKIRVESDDKISKETQENEAIVVNESKKSKKRKNFSSPPPRASKRLAKCEPESNSVLSERPKRLAKCEPESNSVLSERSGRSSRSESTSLPLEPTPSIMIPQQSSDTVQANDPEERALKVVETPQEIEPLNIVENEKLPTEEPAIQEEQIGGERANEMQIDDSTNKSQESQLLYNFGDSWSDPLEFALKTLRGDIPIEETLAFTGGLGGFGYQNNVNFNQENGGLGSSQSDGGPVFFHDAFAPHPESSSKQNGAAAVDKLGASSSSLFSAQGNTVKRDWPAKFNP